MSKSKGIRRKDEASRPPIFRASDGPLASVLPGIAARLEKAYSRPVSTGSVLSKWLLQLGVVVVSTSSKVERLQEYLETPSLPDLTPEEIATIEIEGGKLHKRIFMKQIFE
ncbi:hypothetical protein FISHEDRAFT_62562 [Fistulina hepatica ATCC 64428]|nr:hypothetical protein FISHEDRAFT_62562 [Fistulina hepatica ATCC 64428]